MAFPIHFGFTGFGTDIEKETHLLARRLQGDGAYSEDPDSARDLELRATAFIAADGAQVMVRATENTFPDTATEMLGDWEAVLRIINNAARTIQERQARAVQHYKQPYQVDGATLAAIAEDIGVASSAAVLTPTVVETTKDDAEAESTLHTTFVMTDAEYETPKLLSQFDILARIMPQRMVGSLTRPNSVAEMLVTSEDAEWALASQKVGRTAIRQQTAVQFDHVRPIARHRSYGPLSRIAAADLNAIQDKMLFGRGGSNWNGTTVDGGAFRFAAARILNGTTNIIDDSIDWRDRLVIVVCLSSVTTDIRPGQADEDDLNGSTLDTFQWYTGAGGVNYVNTIQSAALQFRVDVATGSLKIIEQGLASDFSVVVSYMASGDIGSH